MLCIRMSMPKCHFQLCKGEGAEGVDQEEDVDAQQGQEAEGQTVGRTWTGSRRRPGHGRRGTGKYAPENSARCIDIINHCKWTALI